ncbi:anti-sigma factor [Streptomyces albus]|uniref:anti-sigma factor family protein n=1 Tax=Streptomyces albus TaxID=1888 RepID=UPI0004C631D4|nr:hypothetical protein [Streptomyces albus]
MTSTIDTDQHPDVAEISALAEGVLPPERTSAVRGHLNDCDLCTEVRVSLEEIRDLLGTLPGPSRMPADVASRIDAAIAAESLLSATTPDAVSRETDGSASLVSRETGTGSKRSPGVRRSAGRRPHQAGGSTGPARQVGDRRRWRTAALSVACVLGLGVGGAAIVQSMASVQEGGAVAGGETAADTRSGHPGLSAATLESKVRGLLDRGRDGQEKGPSGTEPDTLGAQSSPAQPLKGADVVLPPCIRNGVDPGVEPLAAEESTFEGKQVYIVVLPHHADARKVDAYVVDSSCISTAEPRGDVLLNRVYPRH